VIRPLRTRHRWFFLGLLLVVGPLMVMGLLTRREIPSASPRAAGGKTGLEYRIDRSRPVARVHVTPTAAVPAHPEWSLYWDVSGETDPSVDPSVDTMLFLGVVDGESSTIHPIPTEYASIQGRLVLYSLTQKEIVETVDP